MIEIGNGGGWGREEEEEEEELEEEEEEEPGEEKLSGVCKSTMSRLCCRQQVFPERERTIERGYSITQRAREGRDERGRGGYHGNSGDVAAAAVRTAGGHTGKVTAVCVGTCLHTCGFISVCVCVCVD